MIEIRLKSRIAERELEGKVGRILDDRDYNLVATGDVKILKPDGTPLCVYRRGIIPKKLRDDAYPILHDLHNVYTANRGLAAGSPRVPLKSGKRSEARRVPSPTVGAFGPQGPRTYCRLTSWTAQNYDRFTELQPLLAFIAGRMKVDAAERYARQMEEVERTHPDWVIPGTPFTTLTVNNTYETGVHTDKGDLDEGVSTLMVLRRGNDFKGGVLVFPEYRVGLDMQDGDLTLMDAHEWHGNTGFDPPVDRDSGTGRLRSDPGFERISVVAYFRTNMVKCQSAGAEARKRRVVGETRAQASLGL